MINNQDKEEEEAERKMTIPVFTVIKNGVILKNIFVINNNNDSPSQLNSIPGLENGENPDQENEEILIVGRHPDCNIVLLHPSVSRFHLQINSIPSLQKLFVTDLSSVHGTWVSEKKIDQGFRVELKEGDTIRVGSSRRVYRLHWVPLNRAYDIDNPFVSPSDLAMIQEKEVENADKISQDECMLATENKHDEEKGKLVELGEANEIYQDENPLYVKNGEIESTDSVLEEIVSLFPDENSGLVKEIPTAPLMPDNIDSSCHVGREEILCSSENDNELSLKTVGGAILQTLSLLFYECKQSSGYHSAIEAVLEDEETDISMERTELQFNVQGHDQISDYHSGTEAVLEDEKTDISMERTELEVNVEVFNQSSDYHSAIEAVLEEAKTDISKEIKELESGVEAHNQSSYYHSATEAVRENDKTDISMKSTELEVNVEVHNQSSDYHSATEAMLEDEKTDISMESTELEVNVEVHNQSSDYHSAIEAVLEEEKADISTERIELGSDGEVISPPVSEVYATLACEVLEEAENQSMLRKDNEQIDALECVNCSLAEVGLTEPDNEQENKENHILEPLEALLPPFKKRIQENSTENHKLNMMVNWQTLHADDTAATEILEDDVNQNSFVKDYGQSKPTRFSLTAESVKSSLPLGEVISEVNWQTLHVDDTAVTEILEDDVNQNSFVKDCGQSKPTRFSLTAESVNSSLPLGEVLSEVVDSKECQTPQSTYPATENLENMGSPIIRSDKKSSSCNIWSRRGKPVTPLQLQISKSRKNNRNIDIVADVEYENQQDVESKSIKRVLFSALEPMDEEEVYTPDKENRTPNSFLRNSFKKKGHIEDIHSQKFSSKITLSASFGPDEDLIASSDKENQTPKALVRQRKSARGSRHQTRLEGDMVLKERRVERVPLQSLFSNSPLMSLSEASVPDAAARSSNSMNCTQMKDTSSTSFDSLGNERRRWTMIADTTSLLDKESRKSLQLLEGLKGTHLLIPRTVIREVDYLKRRGSLFRRTTEAELVLQWIEECMLKAKWWIHVQSSVEDAKLIAPTPPASPASQFSQGSVRFSCGTRRSSASFSAYGSLMEIVSPTAEDHIIDYAHSYRKMNHDGGQLVLLSNDVTLKIKAMAEGLICETPQEFRDSLVNPFSERFLWADSSPRGRTWSVLDDVVLKEKYYKSPSKRLSKAEGAKGLKLILLHNSQYRQFAKTM